MKKIQNRWFVAIAGVVMQLMLGSVYGWSVFKKPIMELNQWTKPEVGMAFTLVIFFLGFAAAVGGKYVDKAGARKIATIGGILFAIGTLGAAYAIQTSNLILLYVFYGVIAGIGNGLGYLTPIAVLVRWFPDKKGLITGMAVMGFGLGAAAVGQIAPLLIKNPQIGVANTFYLFGIIFFVVLTIAAQFLNNPPADYSVAAASAKQSATKVSSATLPEALKMNQFYLLWIAFCINITAGIALVSNLSPMAQSQLKITAVAAGTIVAIASLFNGFGRLFWAAISDKLGRKTAFVLIIATQIPAFLFLPQTTSFAVFVALTCYIFLCYGGGFGTMPSFAADTFGSKNIGQIYGKILFAWAVAGAAGPMLLDLLNDSKLAFTGAAGILLIGLVLISLYKKPVLKNTQTPIPELKPVTV
ncbi:MAG: oxalate:formate antiporter [Candidatus Margulisiibacteriota bacterium]|nr:MAG: oxalate:formate antiporter [Candidatus Margulisiibacteriota bacterium]